MNTVEHIRQCGFARINVCGSPGSGKTTIARRIADTLQLPYYDLDAIFYHNDCKPLPLNERIALQGRLIEQDAFVIDGTYRSLLAQRLPRLNCIVITNAPTLVCLHRFLWRAVAKRPTSCGQRITAKTLSLIIQFPFSRKRIESQAHALGIQCFIEDTYLAGLIR